MTASIVVRRVLLAGDHLFGVEKVSVGTSTNFVDDIGLQVAVDGTRNIFALAYIVYGQRPFRRQYVVLMLSYRFQRRRC